MVGPVYPKLLSGAELNVSDNYTCPVCKIQKVGFAPTSVEDRWVHCPMLQNKPISFACCVDLQAPAKAQNFEMHPYHDLFEVVERIVKKDITTLRDICLGHQEEVAIEKIANTRGAFGNSELEEHMIERYTELLEKVRQIKRDLKGS